MEDMLCKHFGKPYPYTTTAISLGFCGNQMQIFQKIKKQQLLNTTGNVQLNKSSEKLTLYQSTIYQDLSKHYTRKLEPDEVPSAR